MALHLADRLLARMDTPDPGVEARQLLDDALAAVVARARQRWPDVEVDRAAFVEFLGDRLEPGVALAPAAVQELLTDDLWLALACAQGVPGAVERFRDAFAVELRRAFERAKVAPEDLEQAFFERLFLEHDGLPPKIVSYAGRGSLRAWVRVAATRHRLNAERGPDRTPVPFDSSEIGDAVTAVSDDAELAYLRERYRPVFARALAQAVSELTSRQRTLLRLSIVRGVSGTQVAELYGVHRATAKRWLASARAELVERTRAGLKDELGVDTRELASLMQLVASNLELSVARHLQSRHP
jgi:RNA polymerase sigma-70 factor (ECF subfamily)